MKQEAPQQRHSRRKSAIHDGEHVKTNQPRVWLITGASSGFGRAIAECALAAGDIVVAAARRTDALADLVASAPQRATALALDVGRRPHPRRRC